MFFRDCSSVWGQDSCAPVSSGGVEKRQCTQFGQCPTFCSFFNLFVFSTSLLVSIFLLPFRSVEGKVEWKLKNFHLPSTTVRRRRRHWTGLRATQLTLTEQQKQPRFHRRVILHFVPATQHHYPPSPWTRRPCPGNATLRKTRTPWCPQELWCRRPFIFLLLDTVWSHTVTGMH